MEAVREVIVVSPRSVVPRFALLIVIGLLATFPISRAQADLVDAAKSGDISQVKELLARNQDVNARDPIYGNTALMQASANDHMDVVQALLAAGADVNAKANSGITALIIAANNGHLEVVQALLATHAEVNAKTARGQTALMAALRNKFVDVVRVLLVSGADVNAEADNGDTPLSLARKQSQQYPGDQKYAQIVQLLEAPPPVENNVQGSGNTHPSNTGEATTPPRPASASVKKPGAPNSDCDHLDLHAGDTLPAMIGDKGAMVRLPNGTWCSLSSQ